MAPPGEADSSLVDRPQRFALVVVQDVLDVHPDLIRREHRPPDVGSTRRVPGVPGLDANPLSMSAPTGTPTTAAIRPTASRAAPPVQAVTVRRAQGP
ncbi:hypothetical protein [Streptomyces canus]|uniref:hypothetical protein n=1 Tax=Streptomyces canus TaxID=58343 RepID=UPI00131A1082|nr:hypothetical protein [Streptomyces canus]